MDEKVEIPMNREDLQFFLLNIVRQIGLIPHDALEAHVKFARNEVKSFDTIVPILDPTYWRNARNNGEFEMAEAHLTIIESILEIRKAMNKHEALRQDYLKKTGGQG